MTELNPLTATLIAAVTAFLIAAMGMIASVHYRLGRLEKGQESLHKSDQETRDMMIQLNRETREVLSMEIRHTRELMAQMEERNNAQHEATRAEIRRLYDAFISHAHDDDGSIIFRIPPQSP